MKCAYEYDATCIYRVGKALTEEEIILPELVPDKEFCKYKQDDQCMCNKQR